MLAWATVAFLVPPARPAPVPPEWRGRWRSQWWSPAGRAHL